MERRKTKAGEKTKNMISFFNLDYRKKGFSSLQWLALLPCYATAELFKIVDLPVRKAVDNYCE